MNWGGLIGTTVAAVGIWLDWMHEKEKERFDYSSYLPPNEAEKNDQEEKTDSYMDQMIKKLAIYPSGTKLTVSWDKEKLVLQGIIDTIYESNNCLAEDDPEYKEFSACIIQIKKIISKPGSFKKKAGDLVEISIENQPTQIALSDGTIVWENK